MKDKAVRCLAHSHCICPVSGVVFFSSVFHDFSPLSTSHLIFCDCYLAYMVLTTPSALQKVTYCCRFLQEDPLL